MASGFATEVFFVIWEVLISSLFSGSIFSNTFEGDNSTFFLTIYNFAMHF